MTEAELAAEQPAADGGHRLSSLDEAFFYYEQPNEPMQIGCVAELDGRLELDELLEALSARLLPLRRFRQRARASAFDLHGTTWEDDPGFDLRRHVRHAALPPPGDEESLRHVVETLFAPTLPPDRPLWEMHLLDGSAGGRSVLLCKVHHSLSDGLSGLGVLERIADPQRRDPSSRSPESQAPATRAIADGSDSSAAAEAGSGALATLRALLKPATVLGRARDVASVLDMIGTFVQQPVTELPLNGRLGHGRRMIWRSFPLDEFASLRLAGDCTINDALLAVVTGALRSYLAEQGVSADEARVRALVPMSLRAPDSPELGNLLTAVFPWLPVDVDDPIERLRRVREEMRSIKSRELGRATGVLLSALSRLPSAARATMLRLAPRTPLVNVGCTSLRGPSQELSLLGRRILEIHPIMNLFQGVGLAFAAASYAGRMSICASTDPALVPDGEQVVDAVEAALYQLRTAHWERSQALRLARCLAEAPRLADVMARDVATVGLNEPLQRALDVMSSNRVRHVAVVDERLRVVRVLSQADLTLGGDKSEATASESPAAAISPASGSSQTFA